MQKKIRSQYKKNQISIQKKIRSQKIFKQLNVYYFISAHSIASIDSLSPKPRLFGQNYTIELEENFKIKCDTMQLNFKTFLYKIEKFFISEKK